MGTTAEYKYRLHYLLRRLPVEDYELTMVELPNRLGITTRTFQRYIYTRTDESYYMPSHHLLQIATWLQVSPGELFSNTGLSNLKLDDYVQSK